MRSRRKARELALRVLYEVETGRTPLEQALAFTIEDAELSADLVPFAQRLVRGVYTRRHEIDDRLAALIPDYDWDRLAAVDRGVMRIAAYELIEEPSIPPAVTLNEAVEIAKKFSTADSGKFVNGVLGQFLMETPKAHWDPATAPEEEREEIVHEPEPQIEEVTLEAGSEEEKKLSRTAGWKLRSDE